MRRTEGPKRALPRFFLGYIDICGVYRSYESALNDLGARACFLNLGNEHRPLTRRQPLILRVFKRLYLKLSDPARLQGASHLRRELNLIYLKSLILLLTAWVAIRFDVIVIKSGEFLTRGGKEIRLLKWLGKTIIFTFHGSDSRPFYLNGQRVADDSVRTRFEEMRQRKERLQACASLATYIVDSPASAHLQATRCCMRQVIGNPAPIEQFKSIGVNKEDREPKRLRVLHAPSLPEVKGSNVIRAVVRKLVADGYDFEYVEVSNLPNSAVLQEIQDCDILIDELYSDNYGGIAALEGLTAGKPVAVCGYAKRELDRFVPEWARAPTVYSHPSDLEDVFKRLLCDEAFRDDRRALSRGFVGDIASPIRSAERLIRLATGEAPEDWFFDPADIRYVRGAAGPEENVQANIRTLVAQFGESALLLDDKPQLKDLLLSFAALEQADDLAPSASCSSRASSPAS